MSNPWFKKNPYLSLWLSAYNGIAATALGQAKAHARRQGTQATTAAARQIATMWSEAMFGSVPKRRKRRR
jgi:hypothetical protein